MALQDYITASDIHNGDFKQLPTETKDAYVDRVNDWFEAYSNSKNVKTSEINFPVNILVTEFLEQKLLMLFATDYINGANTSTNPSKYSTLYVMARDEYNQSSPRINSRIIRGHVDTHSSAVVFGKRVR